MVNMIYKIIFLPLFIFLPCAMKMHCTRKDYKWSRTIVRIVFVSIRVVSLIWLHLVQYTRSIAFIQTATQSEMENANEWWEHFVAGANQFWIIQTHTSSHIQKSREKKLNREWNVCFCCCCYKSALAKPPFLFIFFLSLRSNCFVLMIIF